MPIDKSYIPANRMAVNAAEWDVGGKLNINSGGSLIVEAGGSLDASLATLIKLPAVTQTIFGGSGAVGPFNTFGEEGNIYRNVGNPIAGNAADATDDILDGFVLLPNAFNAKGIGLCLTAQGKFAANGNNKRIKIWINPTMAGQTVTAGVISGGTVTAVGAGVLILDSGVLTDSGVGWAAIVNFFKYGASGANTQYSQGSIIHGATHGGITLPVLSTLTESAAMNVVITGSSGSSAASDVVLNYTEANAMN